MYRVVQASATLARMSTADTGAGPRERLLAGAIEHGIRVIPIPGPSAIMTALAASGYPADQFVFAGFAPSRSKDRKTWLEGLSGEPRTIVFFEAPHRIERTLSEMAAILGDRPITIARELTKIHEEFIRSNSRDVRDLKVHERGEFTVVLAPRSKPADQAEPVGDTELIAYFRQMTDSKTLSRREAIVTTAKKFGLSPNEVYARLERLKTSAPS